MQFEKKIKFGFSPCPNDTFMFDALVNNRIDRKGINFEFIIADVEELNRKAFAEELAFSKMSFHAWLHHHDKYILLNSGSALGHGCGPIVISKKKMQLEDLKDLNVAIPGDLTTANLLLSIFAPFITQKTEMLFSDITDAVFCEEAEAGLIIHEDRFTYMQKGLHKIADLGEMWEKQFNIPLPLGGIFASRQLPKDLIYEVNNLINESIRFAMQNENASVNFIKKHSASLSDSVIREHIKLYVNEFSLTLGQEGKRAVNLLCEKAETLGIIINKDKPNFIIL